MKVFLINGSPKGSRSNTYQLSQAFLAGLAPEEVRECILGEREIKPCLGCFACWNKTPGSCCLSDDMAGVIRDLLWADVVIWNFPLYYFSVPGPMKNLIDRMLPTVLPFMNQESDFGGHPSRYDMSGKRHVLISTCGFYTAQGNYGGVEHLFDHFCGKGNYTTIFCGQGELFRVKELRQRTQEYLQTVTQAGREFASGDISRETRENLSVLLFPRETFEAMADASWGIEKSGEVSDESLTFTRQMAALYNKSAFSGKEKVLEMAYTDIGKRYQIVLGKAGSSVLTEEFRTPTTIIETTYSLWKSIAAGEISGEQALMEQKYRVKGDFDLMIQWNRYFGSQTDAAPAQTEPTAKTSMLNLLSWAALWSLIGLHPVYGPLAVIGLCTLLPVVLYRTKKTVYDVLSSLVVTLCACGALVGVSIDYVMMASLFCFGLMWAVSCFFHVPLSAHYVINQYGDAMAENPLFLRTNRIICAGWGILYILVPLVMLLTMGTPYASLAGLLQAVGSGAMGIFTLWFQKWYPAYVARGK